MVGYLCGRPRHRGAGGPDPIDWTARATPLTSSASSSSARTLDEAVAASASGSNIAATTCVTGVHGVVECRHEPICSTSQRRRDGQDHRRIPLCGSAGDRADDRASHGTCSGHARRWLHDRSKRVATPVLWLERGDARALSGHDGAGPGAVIMGRQGEPALPPVASVEEDRSLHAQIAAAQPDIVGSGSAADPGAVDGGPCSKVHARCRIGVGAHSTSRLASSAGTCVDAALGTGMGVPHGDRTTPSAGRYVRDDPRFAWLVAGADTAREAPGRRTTDHDPPRSEPRSTTGRRLVTTQRATPEVPCPSPHGFEQSSAHAGAASWRFRLERRSLLVTDAR